MAGDVADDDRQSPDQAEAARDVPDAQDAEGEDVASEETWPDEMMDVLENDGAEINDAAEHDMEVPAVPSWSITVGGPGTDSIADFQMTADGGFIIAGRTMSFGAGLYDAWIVRFDPLGNILWDRTYGGPDTDGAASIRGTSDGGYIVGGYTRSFGAGDYDFWVIKLDVDGSPVWQKTYGGDDEDMGNQVRPTFDGGYVFSGDTRSFGFLNPRTWIIKTDDLGEVVWDRIYAPSFASPASGIEQTSDGGYISTGVSWQHDDAFIIKVDEEGDPLWQILFGGEEYETASSILELDSGGFLVSAGIWYYVPVPGLVDIDIWLLTIDPAGNLLGQNMYRSSALERIYSMEGSPDGGFFLAGSTSFRTDTHSIDVLVMKVSAGGAIAWQRAYGGEEEDFAVSIRQSPDGGFIVAGQTESFGAGDYDVWILKMDGNGLIDVTCPADMTETVSMVVVPTDHETTTITEDPVTFGAAVSDTTVSPAEAWATVEKQCGP